MVRIQVDIRILRDLSRNLLWSGIVTLIVGLKLVVSYLAPGLKTPGELMLSGGLLLVYTARIFRVRYRLERELPRRD
jgi:hypothetical protein